MRRFVVVPAVPAVPEETGARRNGSRFYCMTPSLSFNIYDNERKYRLNICYLYRSNADEECERLNSYFSKSTLHGIEPTDLIFIFVAKWLSEG